MKLEYLITIFIDTDNDWGFKAVDGPAKETYLKYYSNTCLWGVANSVKETPDGEWHGKLSYDAYGLPLAEPGCYYAFGFYSSTESRDHLLENTLNRLKEDLSYSSHEWIRQDFDNLMNSAIEFLRKQEPGTFVKRLESGNWQLSTITIVAVERD